MRALMLGLAFLGAPSFADEPPKPAPVMPAAVGPKVKVELRLVHAQHGEAYVDPKLTEMLDMLKTLPFERFELLDEHMATLTDGTKDAVQLDGGRRLVVHQVSHDEKVAQVRIEFLTGDTQVLDTTVSIHRNRVFYLAVRNYKGGSLMIQVGVRY